MSTKKIADLVKKAKKRKKYEKPKKFGDKPDKRTLPHRPKRRKNPWTGKWEIVEPKPKPLPHKIKYEKNPETGKMEKVPPKMQKMKKKHQDGGKMKGPSHNNGGIPIEVEGGEYVIKKSSVNKQTEPILESINKTGKFNYQSGGKTPHYDARKRRK